MILKKISTVYKYIFYKLYRWSGAVNARHEPDEIQATIMFSFSIMLNLAMLEAIMHLSVGFSLIGFLHAVNMPDIYVGVFAIAIMLLNFYILRFRIGFKEIIREFESESRSHEKTGNIFVALYVIGSLLLLFGSWFGIYLKKEVFGL